VTVSKKAVVLAGVKGSWLGPYTTVLPKPLLADCGVIRLDGQVGETSAVIGYEKKPETPTSSAWAECYGACERTRSQWIGFVGAGGIAGLR
jgi:hypothetical protein